jgi:hypothetical protein
MTYPPQPGQPYPGQQPDPHGQGGYPPSGGFPQQPYQGQQYPPQYPPMYPQQPQYPQQPPYPQQSGPPQYPPPPQQQYPDFSPSPVPKKRRTVLWTAILVVLVLVIAFAVTAFLAPGFLLSAEKQKSETVAQQLVDALGKKDAATLNSLKCATTGPDVGRAIDEVDKVKAATLSGPPVKVNDTEDSAVISVTSAGKPAPYTVTFADQDGKWCWKDITKGAKP